MSDQNTFIVEKYTKVEVPVMLYYISAFPWEIKMLGRKELLIIQ